MYDYGTTLDIAAVLRVKSRWFFGDSTSQILRRRFWQEQSELRTRISMFGVVLKMVDALTRSGRMLCLLFRCVLQQLENYRKSAVIQVTPLEQNFPQLSSPFFRNPIQATFSRRTSDKHTSNKNTKHNKRHGKKETWQSSQQQQPQ